MALTKLNQLYRAVIVDHSKNPRRRGTLDNKTTQIEIKNPTCGDVIEIQLEIKDNKIKDIRFDGSGCTISLASASMMTDSVMGKTLEEALLLSEDFSSLVQGKDPEHEDDLGDAVMLSGVAKFPARIKCATLPWKALEKALTSEDQSGIDSQLKHDN
ncbi:MAG: SUF system NifU family Fe-S cluster assembly protein [Alkalibacterium sp.]|uniref:Nitrogen fixation protein NifU n=1 Tax=Alkalibacterium gilvum TaxID=1130080 RepID=A0A1H6UI61_9LACT|nr:SUF system NifU family Fe-S cluster assembly protein [Alkalibacterium gilvum]MDN6193609.1 SUF system NifU family Fe-S cluster assembly protein [Alkalibacterium sp.]MDN6294150.1 SUF system NifU family Fe-S cluster assembly protein [Alkalibacterium sp.]MDN6326514.1 SUF system NifU family Fe-S cluster assembly protein [Alkalibacterium sp.]MDN6398165.1 SUF system NifU family Fe-S cluster assembly protein [Alkalibacterium sp.]MDN6730015.1 SUF system NifU family Fe-S cluster assembly protein [Alk